MRLKKVTKWKAHGITNETHYFHRNIIIIKKYDFFAYTIKHEIQHFIVLSLFVMCIWCMIYSIIFQLFILFLSFFFFLSLQQVDDKYVHSSSSGRNAHYTKQHQANPSSHDKLESSVIGSYTRGSGSNSANSGISSLTVSDKHRGEFYIYFKLRYVNRKQNKCVNVKRF